MPEIGQVAWHDEAVHKLEISIIGEPAKNLSQIVRHHFIQPTPADHFDNNQAVRVKNIAEFGAFGSNMTIFIQKTKAAQYPHNPFKGSLQAAFLKFLAFKVTLF